MQSPSQRDSKALAASVNAELSHEAPCQACFDPHGGLGMYAKRAVAAGERILLEQPLTITPTHDARHSCAPTALTTHASARAATASTNTIISGHATAQDASCCAAARKPAKAPYISATVAPLNVRPWHCSRRRQKRAASRHANALETPIWPTSCFKRCASLSDRHAGVSVRAYQSRTVSFSSYTQRLVGGGDDAMVTTALEAVARAALAVVPEAARIPVSDLASVLRYHQANVYSVLSRGGNEIASASFVGALHLFNHSCAPNLAFDCVPIRTAGAPEAICFLRS